MDGGKKKKRNWGNLVGEKNCPRFFPGEKKRDGERNGAGQVVTPDQQPKELSLLWWTQKKPYFTLTVSHASGVFSLIPGACRLP